jgi:uncharacterized protein YjbJ (UPF0337 family)
MKHRGIDNQAEGLRKRIDGKVDEVAGAVKGDTSQELGGKVKRNLGKVQQRFGEEQTELEVERERRRRDDL